MRNGVLLLLLQLKIKQMMHFEPVACVGNVLPSYAANAACTHLHQRQWLSLQRVTCTVLILGWGMRESRQMNREQLYSLVVVTRGLKGMKTAGSGCYSSGQLPRSPVANKNMVACVCEAPFSWHSPGNLCRFKGSHHEGSQRGHSVFKHLI
ncbi:hypothetical protein QYF61_027891 [Mycteria americana]|uniref:Secreted protein n=1 Tax=Mycteria americana TaxID=33587 RepID=A0AAN7MMI0_MYCAM|nr:hypothetical protein QYF61_027891 [Mycteria americana]